MSPFLYPTPKVAILKKNETENHKASKILFRIITNIPEIVNIAYNSFATCTIVVNS